MSDPQEQVRRWFHDKTAPHGVKSALALATGYTPTKISRMRNLETDNPKNRQAIPLDMIKSAAVFFNELPPGFEGTQWLEDAGKDHEDGMTYDVPVLSSISASSFREQDGVRPADINRHIKVSHLPPGDWFALTVEGSSMDRIAPDGALIIVNRADDNLLDGKDYVFSLNDGAATFKRYRHSPEPMLTPFTWSPDHYSIPIGDRDLYVFGRVRRVILDL